MEIELPGLLNLVKKPLLKVVKGTIVEDLFERTWDFERLYVEIKNIAGGNHQSLAVLVSPCTPFQGTLENRGAYVMPLRGDDMVFGASY